MASHEDNDRLIRKREERREKGKSVEKYEEKIERERNGIVLKNDRQ